MRENKLLPQLFRTEYRKLVSVLYHRFGFDHLSIAEDIAGDTFLIAAETWGIKGVPENPIAWLHTVARNKAMDVIRREHLFAQKVVPVLGTDPANAYQEELDLSEQNIHDSQLKMMFTICHPSIPVQSQIGLSLRILCGFGIEEIAEAFLTNKETIAKRLQRAKDKLRQQKVKIEFPDKEVLGGRLQAVYSTLYLLFNEGYYSNSKNSIIRKELCLEAMRLTLMLIEDENTNTPQANALMALMCFHSSRFEARTGEQGDYIRYDEQDCGLWNQALIEKGNQYLNLAATDQPLGRYHLEAAIAYWHTHKKNTPEKWNTILQLYNRLLQLSYSPVAALNRTYALSKAKGKAAAITAAEALQLNTNHLYHLLLGYLYTDVDQLKAKKHLQTALKMAKSLPERQRISEDIAKLS
jgi:RNA polymerase sigma factor (sigma-70 family)